MKKFIATYIQTGDTSDGRPRVLGVYNTKTDATYEVECDMEEWYCHTRYGEDLESNIDYDKLTAKIADIECVWNIEEIEIND